MCCWTRKLLVPFTCSLEGRNLSSIYAYIYHFLVHQEKVTILVQYLQKNKFARLQCKSVIQACEWQLVGSPVTTLLNTLWKFLITALKKANTSVSLSRAACLWIAIKSYPEKLIHIPCEFRLFTFWLLMSDVCCCGLTWIKTFMRPTKLLPQLQVPCSASLTCSECSTQDTRPRKTRPTKPPDITPTSWEPGQKRWPQLHHQNTAVVGMPDIMIN